MIGRVMGRGGMSGRTRDVNEEMLGKRVEDASNGFEWLGAIG